MEQNPEMSMSALNLLLVNFVNGEVINPIWGQDLRVPKTKDAIEKDEGSNIENFTIDIDNFLLYADDTSVKCAVMTGSSVGSSSHGLDLDSVCVISNEGFAGSTIEDYAPDTRGRDDKRSLDCENINAKNSYFGGKNIFRNLKGGIIRDSIICGVDVLKDAWGGLILENVIIIDQNGVRHIKRKEYPRERPYIRPTKPYEAKPYRGEVGGNSFIPKKPIR